MNISNEAVEAAERARQMAVLEPIVQSIMAAAWDECVASDTPWINPYRKPA